MVRKFKSVKVNCGIMKLEKGKISKESNPLEGEIGRLAKLLM